MRTRIENCIPWQWKFTIKIGLPAVLAIVSATVIVSYIFVPNARDSLAFATAVIGGAAVVYGASYAGISLRIGAIQARRAASFWVLERLHMTDLAEVRRLIDSKVRGAEEISRNELYEKITGNIETLTAVISTLGLWEDIAVGIRFGCLDEDVLFYSLSFLIPWHYDKMRPYIDEERTRSGDPYLFSEMQRLANSWKANTSLITGKEYHFPAP